MLEGFGVGWWCWVSSWWIDGEGNWLMVKGWDLGQGLM